MKREHLAALLCGLASPVLILALLKVSLVPLGCWLAAWAAFTLTTTNRRRY